MALTFVNTDKIALPCCKMLYNDLPEAMTYENLLAGVPYILYKMTIFYPPGYGADMNADDRPLLHKGVVNNWGGGVL